MYLLHLIIKHKYNIRDIYINTQPHVTLVSRITELDFTKLETMCENINPFTIYLENLESSTTSIKFFCRKTREIVSARELTLNQNFKIQYRPDREIAKQKEYHPHLSLIYHAKDRLTEIYETNADMIHRSVENYKEFETNRIEIWYTPGPGQKLKEWSYVTSIPLGNANKKPKILYMIDHMLSLIEISYK